MQTAVSADTLALNIIKPLPLISVCIPLYNTEPFLAQCLRSVYTQDFKSFEIIVVSDASKGKDEKGRKAKKIVKLAQKESDKYRKEKNLPAIAFKFIEHKENRGLIEVRRTLCYEASGMYMTQCDSDDEMVAGALSALYSAAQESGFDIIHGTSTAGVFDEEGNFTPVKENRYGSIFYGELTGHQVFRTWLLDGRFTANTWGKLIKRDLWLQAYEHIPYTECSMADDILLFFFLGQYASSYKGIEAKVYRYRINSGMSSRRKIDSLRKWKMICTTASVFTVISQWLEEKTATENNPDNSLPQILPDEIAKIRQMTQFYLCNNIRQMREAVIPELQPAARAMLCDYWGESFVERIEAEMDKAEKEKQEKAMEE